MKTHSTLTQDVAPPPLSVERQALAAAIKELSEFDAEIAAIGPAISKLDNQITDARHVRDKAAETLAGAQEASAKHLADTALGKNPSSPVAFREARAAAMESDDSLVALRRARATLRERQNVLHEMQHHSPKTRDVKAAAAAVIKSEVNAEALCAEIQKLQDELIQKRLVLCFLHDLRVGIVDGELMERWFLPTTNCQWPDILPIQWRRNPSPDWKSALDDLCADATTQIPVI